MFDERGPDMCKDAVIRFPFRFLVRQFLAGIRESGGKAQARWTSLSGIRGTTGVRVA